MTFEEFNESMTQHKQEELGARLGKFMSIIAEAGVALENISFLVGSNHAEWCYKTDEQLASLFNGVGVEYLEEALTLAEKYGITTIRPMKPNDGN